MRIAILSSISFRTPPRHCEATELMTSFLTEGLHNREVEVTLFATADSVTSAKLESVCPHPYKEDKSLNPKVWEALHISHLFERAYEFDLIHNHTGFLPLIYTNLVDTPVLTTIHGFSSSETLQVYKKYNKKAHYVSISDMARHPELDYIATIYYGIPPDKFAFRAQRGDYLLFLENIKQYKELAEAIEVSEGFGMRLVIAGTIQDPNDFNEKFASKLDGEKVIYVGPACPEKKEKLLGNAYALLHLVDFEEHFSLNLVEAMACGTPAVAFPKGSVCEIIEHGRTGFVVKGTDEAIEALRRIPEIDPAECRKEVERRFSLEGMINNYLRLYEEVIQSHKIQAKRDVRPWGSFEVLEDREHYKLKRIEVLPGKRLSYQKHARRSEHWMVVEGEAIVTLDGEEIPLCSGNTIDIPRNSAHRIANQGYLPLVFIEIQQGDYFGEDDIIRLEDDFGRSNLQR